MNKKKRKERKEKKMARRGAAPPAVYSPDVFRVNPVFTIGHQLINCSDKELVTLEPPSGQTCGEFMARYTSSRGGYLTNPDASTTCQFCSCRTTDEWMEPTFNIFYQHHCRDFGLFCVYIIFNVSFVSL